MLNAWSLTIIYLVDCRSRQYQETNPVASENIQNPGSNGGPKQEEIPEWERARQALAKVSNQNVKKSPAKSSSKTDTNVTSTPTNNQQQLLAYQQYHPHYFSQWYEYTYPFQYPGYPPSTYHVPPQPRAPQPSVPPPPVCILTLKFLLLFHFVSCKFVRCIANFTVTQVKIIVLRCCKNLYSHRIAELEEWYIAIAFLQCFK